jgi:hypothetical protein
MRCHICGNRYQGKYRYRSPAQGQRQHHHQQTQIQCHCHRCSSVALEAVRATAQSAEYFNANTDSLARHLPSTSYNTNTKKDGLTTQETRKPPPRTPSRLVCLRAGHRGEPRLRGATPEKTTPASSLVCFTGSIVVGRSFPGGPCVQAEFTDLPTQRQLTALQEGLLPRDPIPLAGWPF